MRGQGFLADDLTDHALRFLEAQRERPFFCYLPLNTPHSPMQVPDKFYDKFKNADLKLRHDGSQTEDLAVTRAALANWLPVFFIPGQGGTPVRYFVLISAIAMFVLSASLLHATSGEAERGRWPADWAAAPADARFTGIDVMPKDVARARGALGSNAEFVCADMRSVAFPAADTIVILDALHYIETTEQDAVLARVRGALGRGGRLVLRVGDAGDPADFYFYAHAIRQTD